MHQPSDSSQDSRYVRRVLLPSGRAIELVYVDDGTGDEPDPVAVESVESHVHELHVCPDCTGRLVYPVAWREASDTHWEVSLRCPDCEWRALGEYDQRVVDRFDEELDDGTEILIRDLRRLTQANMEEELSRFSSALEADAIWPMDF